MADDPKETAASFSEGEAASSTETASTLREQDWFFLLRAIELGKCTPFLGAGACHGLIPLGADIAEEWARDHGYPFADSHDLARVAQFVATQYHSLFPKDVIVQRWKKATLPDFSDPTEPHSLLADLPLPIYITTNYDDFMLRALKSRNRDAKTDSCRWNPVLRNQRPAPSHEPSIQAPLVYHFHGTSNSEESLVLTEDDYLQFLVNLGRYRLIPPRIERALTGASILFLGYKLADWDFRVLFQGLTGYMGRNLQRGHISVQLAPGDRDASPEQKIRAQNYLSRYFDKLSIRVYWGTCREFTAELRSRWSTHRHARLQQ
jgi:hypothetical protein